MKTASKLETLKDTARQLFFVEGNFNITTQEIADRAGVNRTLLHYYFRSREELFNIVYRETVDEKINELYKVFESNEDFYAKLENIIDIVTAYLHKYPFAQVFLLTELNKKNER